MSDDNAIQKRKFEIQILPCKSFELASKATLASKENYYGTKQKTESIDFAKGSERRLSISLRSMPKRAEEARRKASEWNIEWMKSGSAMGLHAVSFVVFVMCHQNSECRCCSLVVCWLHQSGVSPHNLLKKTDYKRKISFTMMALATIHFHPWKGFTVKLKQHLRRVMLADSLLIIKYTPIPSSRNKSPLSTRISLLCGIRRGIQMSL